jgi:hypothetical protein
MTAVAIAATPVRVGSKWLVGGLVLLVTFVVAQWAAVPYVVGVFHDDGIYALLAQSIARGEGFHHSHLVGNPAATHYPPLYPLILGALWRVAPAFPANLPLLLGLNAVLLAVAAAGWWYFAVARLAWTQGGAAAGALVATVASPVLILSSALLSEPLFMALLWPALLLAERAADSGERRNLAIAGIVIGILMLARTHALALLLALVLVLALRRRWRDAVVAIAICLVVQLPWLLWSRLAGPRVPPPLEGAYGSYIGWFATGVRDGGAPFLASTARANLAESWMLLQDRFAAGLPVPLFWLVMLLVLGAVMAGGWSLARRTPVTVVFLLLYLGVVIAWPYTPWRFVWAVWPLVAMLALEGARTLWPAPRALRIVAGAAAAIVGLSYLRTELRAYATRSWRAPARQAAAQIAPVVEWVRRRTATMDAVLSDGEQVIALYTGRRAAPPIDFTAREYLTPPRGAEATARLSAMVSAVPARYVIVLAPSLAASADALASHRPSLRRLESLAGGVVYEVVR